MSFQITNEIDTSLVPKIMSFLNFISGCSLLFSMISCHSISGHIEGVPVLAEVGSLHLEFQHLTHITGDPVYLNKVKWL